MPLWLGVSFKKSRWRFEEFEVWFVKEVLEGLVGCAGDIVRVKVEFVHVVFFCRGIS